MSKKKLAVLATLLLLLLLALVACGGDDGDTGTDSGESSDNPVEAVATEVTDATDDEPGEDGGEVAAGGESACMGIPYTEGSTIVFSGWGDETEQKIYRDSIDRFTAACPGITVDYQPVPADFQTQMKAAFAGGEGPDVIYVDDQLMTALGRTGQLLPLDPYFEQSSTMLDEFIQPLLTIFTLDGQTYALPKDWGTLGLVYLPEAFEEAGVEMPTADWTWEDLRQAAKAIADNTDYAGFCQGADWARFAPWAFSHGASFVSEDGTQATLTDDGIITAAQLVADMKEEGSLSTGADLGAGWCGEAIGKKLAAMTLEGGWMVNFMKNDYADVEWAAVPVPAGPEGEADIIFTNGIGVNASTEHPNEAALFTLFLTGPDNQAAIAETGFAYPARGNQLALIENENDRAISEGGTYELTRVAFWGPNTGRVNDAVSKALERVFLGDQDIATSFEQAQEEAQMALDEGASQ